MVGLDSSCFDVTVTDKADSLISLRVTLFKICAVIWLFRYSEPSWVTCFTIGLEICLVGASPNLFSTREEGKTPVADMPPALPK